MSHNILYSEKLLDHYRYPRNRGILDNPDFSTQVLNPSCGDSINCSGTIIDQKMSRIRFSGTGCVISQAAASLLSEQIVHRTIDQLNTLTKDDMLAFVGISLGPTRLRCALLALEALHQGLITYAQSHENIQRTDQSMDGRTKKLQK
ncbi:MAG: iron-sulfur cluster assembly scaffold protein [Candidatus Babeliaceae bacterium]